MQKNEIIDIEITDITTEGNGVGRYNGMAVFIPETAVGDVIEARIVKVLKNYAYGIVNRIINPSADRIKPDCPHFPKCGGCSFRHISYDAELKIKEKFVYDAFTRIGKIDCEFMPILGCENPDGYRNKAQYPVSETDDGKIICGFYAKRSHRIIGGSKCRLLPDEFCSIAEYIVNYCFNHGVSSYSEKTHKGILRHIYLRKAPATGEIMVCLVATKNYNFDELCGKLTERYSLIKTVALNINPDNTNVILGKETIILKGSGKITDIMCGNVISISPETFYQINSPQAEKLYRIAEEFAELNGNEKLLDLYCGAGTIGLSMADKVSRLIGVEIIPQAVDNARENAENSGVKNAEFICSDSGKAAEYFAEIDEAPDVIVLDPPRKGCDKLTLDSVIKMKPQKIIMISCNPSTAARDCSYFSENGFDVKKVKAVDLFPRTAHVETVVLLSKGEIDSKKIRVEFSLEDMDMSEFQDGATYPQIKEYVLEHTGLKVSNLYISQIKRKCGIEVGKNYNQPKSEDSRQPQCPPEKEKAIREAFKYFGMI